MKSRTIPPYRAHINDHLSPQVQQNEDLLVHSLKEPSSKKKKSYIVLNVKYIHERHISN